jgi:hypothetical protein
VDTTAFIYFVQAPGTVAFLGYGREVTDDEAFRFDGLAPRTDGLFLKLSYLFRN